MSSQFIFVLMLLTILYLLSKDSPKVNAETNPVNIVKAVELESKDTSQFNCVNTLTPFEKINSNCKAIPLTKEEIKAFYDRAK